MLQELFRIPGLNLPIYGYGLMLVIGVLLGVELMKFLARRIDMDPEIFATAGLIALVTGVIGARVSHVIENWAEFVNPTLNFGQSVWKMLNISSGGLTYYGGLILAFPVVVLYGLYKKVSIRKGMDVVAPCLVLALGFGRIGCFLNGCCYGAECEVPWAVTYPYRSIPFDEQFREGKLTPPSDRLLSQNDGLPLPVEKLKGDPQLLATAKTWRSLAVHPAQLYSTLTSFLICGILLCYFTLPHAPGRVMAMMFLLEGPTRFLLEMLRVEPTVAGPLSLSMVLGLIFGVLGIVLWMVFGVMHRSPNPAPAVS